MLFVYAIFVRFSDICKWIISLLKGKKEGFNKYVLFIVTLVDKLITIICLIN